MILQVFITSVVEFGLLCTLIGRDVIMACLETRRTLDTLVVPVSLLILGSPY